MKQIFKISVGLKNATSKKKEKLLDDAKLEEAKLVDLGAEVIYEYKDDFFGFVVEFFDFVGKQNPNCKCGQVNS